MWPNDCLIEFLLGVRQGSSKLLLWTLNNTLWYASLTRKLLQWKLTVTKRPIWRSTQCNFVKRTQYNGILLCLRGLTVRVNGPLLHNLYINVNGLLHAYTTFFLVWPAWMALDLISVNMMGGCTWGSYLPLDIGRPEYYYVLFLSETSTVFIQATGGLAYFWWQDYLQEYAIYLIAWWWIMPLWLHGAHESLHCSYNDMQVSGPCLHPDGQLRELAWCSLLLRVRARVIPSGWYSFFNKDAVTLYGEYLYVKKDLASSRFLVVSRSHGQEIKNCSPPLVVRS